MKLNISRPNIESSGQLKEEMFSIKDQGMIFDILRSKMYSNNIYAICREIACNARDAHREVNKDDVAIEITFPNSLEPFFKIKDYGPGISPDRMSNVFIQYTASTKREDNRQTGGFGLGAKTPFAYSDTFTIVTRVDGIQYNYACFIDETRVGKLSLLSTEETTEGNGTEIVLPVKSADFQAFRDWTEVSTRHWDVRPIIHGDPDFKWFDHSVVVEGTNWRLCNKKDYYKDEAKIIIDGIQYPLDKSSIETFADIKILNALNGDLFIYFEIGELTLSANREQVYLDDSTKEKIKNRLQFIVSELTTNISTKINSYDNLWLANIFYRTEINEIIHNINILGNLKWKAFTLSNYAINTGVNVFSYRKDKYGSNPQIRRRLHQSLTFEKSSVLFINDLPIKEPTAKHVKKIFDDPLIESVQVICPNDKIKIEDLNAKIHLEEMAPQLLSSVTKASGRTYKSPSSRLLVFKFYSAVKNQFRLISYKGIKEDKNIKLLINIYKDSTGERVPHLKSGKSISLDYIESILSCFPDISVYGIDSNVSEKRIEEDFGDFFDFETWIKEKIVSLNIDFIKIKVAQENYHYVDEQIIREISSYESNIQDPNSLFLLRAKTHQSIKNALSIKQKGLLHIYEHLVGQIDDQKITNWLSANNWLDLSALDEECRKKYPLLDHLATYRRDKLVEPISQYINLIDKA